MRGTTILSTNWLIVFGLAALIAATLFATGVFIRTATAVTPRYVDPAGVDVGTCTPIASACATISFAIGVSAAGDIINVATGTYAEQVTIDKSVTLIGDVGGKPKIDASGMPSAVTITSSNVTLDNFDITGDASTHVGVAVYGSGSDITGTSIVNNNIHDISGSFPAAFYSFGILVNGNADDISGLVINNNEIDSIGNIGSGVSGAGISLESLSGASLDGNTISNIDGNGISGAGIFLQSPTAAFTVLNNSVDTADIGIVNYSANGSTDITRGAGTFTNVPVYVVDVPGGTSVDINLQHAMLTGIDPALGALLGLDAPTSSGVEVYTPLIQTAIDLASPAGGSTIDVTAGTYPGSITIDKALTLSCAQAGVAVTSRTEGSAAESIIDRTGSYSGIVIKSSNVTVDGCDIIGDAATSDGVYVAANANSFSNITVANNFIHGMAKENTSNASVYSYGVLADAKVSETGPFGSISALSITGNSIHDIGGVVDGAITSGGLGLSLHEISGASAGDGVTVTGNIFNSINDGWDGSSVAPAVGVSVLENGLQTSPSSGASVTGNSYTDTAGGVAVFATSSSVSETGGSFTNVTILVLNIGRLATIDEVALGQFAKSDTLTLVPFSDGYFAKIQDAIDNSDPGATISVSAGTYTEAVTVNKKVTLAGLNPPGGVSAAVVNGTVDLTAAGATVQSLKVVPGSVTGNERAIAVYAGNTTVTGNLIDGMTGDGTGGIVGVGIYSGSKPALLNINVTYNVIKNIDNQQPGVLFGGADGIMVQGVVDGVNIIGNTIKDIHSAGWAYGIEVTPTAGDPANPPQNVLVQLNNISFVNDGSVYNVVVLAPYAAPYPGVGFTLDETALGAADGDASQVIVTNNFFVSLIVGAINKDTAHILNAESNWWGACDGPSGFGPGSGAAVSDNVDFIPWNASKCDTDNDLLTDDEEIFVYFTDPNNPDTDGDGCIDGREVLPKNLGSIGGGRDPLNSWDWYDVNQDGVIDLVNDILGVIDHWQPLAGGAPPYDIAFDRGPSAGPNPWNMTTPDGIIDLVTDILGVIDQWSPLGCR